MCELENLGLRKNKIRTKANNGSTSISTSGRRCEPDATGVYGVEPHVGFHPKKRKEDCKTANRSLGTEEDFVLTIKTNFCEGELTKNWGDSRATDKDFVLTRRPIFATADGLRTG